MSTNSKAHLALSAVALIYGANYVIAKGLMPEPIGASGFIFMRVLGALILFWIFYLFQFEKIAKKDILRLAACGLTGVAINQLFFFNGLSLTSPLNSAIIMTSNPILVLIIATVITKAKLTKAKVGGVLLGAIGAATLILSSNSGNDALSSSKGDIMILVNAVSYGLYLVTVKPLMTKYKPLTVITWVFTFGFCFVLPFGFEQFAEVDFEDLTQSQWWRLSFVVIGTTFLAYLLNIFALKTVLPTVSSSYIYLQPIFVSVFTYIFTSIDKNAFTGGVDYSADISLLKIVCTLFIFTGVYLVSKSPKPR